MSDTHHGFMLDVNALIDDIRAKSKRRDSENFEQSEYAGLKGSRYRTKYRDCEYVRSKGQSVRRLSADEIAQLQACVQREMVKR